MENIIKFATEISRQNTEEKLNFRHGCVITKGREILSFANNTFGMRIMGESVTTRHAEMNAYSSLLRSRKNSISIHKRYSLMSTRKKWCEKVGYICN